ncbi:MAG TPA: hypothetical protein VMM12_00040 [Longimicrobiales bacterium]|nr:hypothetical protein [Longimicrobiales bacterium]
MGETKSLLGRIVTWTIIGVLAVLAFRIALRLLAFVMGLAGMVLGMVAFAVFTLGPLVLLGWLAVKAWNALARREEAI